MAVVVLNYAGHDDRFDAASHFTVDEDSDLRVFEDVEVVALYPAGSYHRVVNTGTEKKEN